MIHAARQEFRARLHKPDGYHSTFILMPFNVESVFNGSGAPVKVTGLIDGMTYHGWLQASGDGSYKMIVPKALLLAISKGPGDMVQVSMERDTRDYEMRPVTPPEDFQQALERNTQAMAAFADFSYSQQKLYVRWIQIALKQTTRKQRIQKAVERIAQGLKFS